MKLFKNDLRPEFIYNKNDAEIYYKHCFLNKDEADGLFVKILGATPWDKKHITLFGKKHLIPRMESWHGDGNYKYSGIKHEAKGWTPELAFVKKRIEKFVDIKFNSVLANLYRDGSDSNGWHSDNEKELGENPIIASLSLGASRKFKLRNNRNGESIDLILENGSLLIMAGSTQTYWKHTVPKTRQNVSPRINLTYRVVNNLKL